jgi:Transposase IS66 family
MPLDPKRRPKGMQTRRKRAFDLVITPGAIRRKVIEFRAVAYRCTHCDRCFIPERYERLARHFHRFMSWFAYQHITHRIGIKSLAGLFYEIFGIQVNWWEFLAFRHLLVRRYGKTSGMLLAQLMVGSVLHIDETEIKLRDGSGYVWVFASESATVYIFRRSREGDFLRKMLKDFRECRFSTATEGHTSVRWLRLARGLVCTATASGRGARGGTERLASAECVAMAGVDW